MHRASFNRSALIATAALAITATASAAVRDIQITRIDTTAGIVTLTNLGAAPQALDGYRFCTADDDQQLEYTAASGLNGITLASGETLEVYWNNDGPGTPGTIDVGALGGNTAQPMGNGPFGLAIYFATPFGIGTNMADYVQWTDDLSNPGNAMADARADEAEFGGVWTGVADFVVTTTNTVAVVLEDLGGNELHSPSNYSLDESEVPCDGDITGDNIVDFNDVLPALTNWGPCPGCKADINGDGEINFGDLLIMLSNWGPCP